MWMSLIAMAMAVPPTETWTTGDIDEHLFGGDVGEYVTDSLPVTSGAEMTLKYGLWNSPDVTFEVYLNGGFVGDVVADAGYGSPGPAYETWDVTALMVSGENLIEVYALSSSGEAVVGRIDIEYESVSDSDKDGFDYGEDCDDTDPQTYPGAPELCDGLDNDCDEVVPDDELDLDKDGYRACEGDCDDVDIDINPGVKEVCDGVDTDCDGFLLEEERDDDADGYYECTGDCDISDDRIYPGATDIPDDGIDQDCNGFDTLNCYLDDDADGYGVGEPLLLDDAESCEDYFMAVEDGDCDPMAASVYPGAEEVCEDTIDQDCDGTDLACEVAGDTGDTGDTAVGDELKSCGCGGVTPVGLGLVWLAFGAVGFRRR